MQFAFRTMRQLCPYSLLQLTATLEQTKAEVLRLHSEREEYEATMKKAFMRGVCALNLEAMTMFQGKDSRTDPGQYKKLL